MIYMDFCPSESFNGAQKAPNSPFVAAGCVIVDAQPETEKRIHSRLGPKTKSARLGSLRMVRRAIEAGQLRLHAVCIAGEEHYLTLNGALNCMSTDKLELVTGLPSYPFLSNDACEKAFFDAGEQSAENIAREIGGYATAKKVISTAAFLGLSHHCAAYFLEKAARMRAPVPEKVKVIIDKIPGEDLAVFDAMKARLRCFRIPTSFGAVLEVNVIAGKKEDPFEIVIADFLAYVTAGITAHFAAPGEDAPRIIRSGELPKLNSRERKAAWEFSDFMLKGGHLLHTTPTVLKKMADGGAGAIKQVEDIQKYYGLDYTDTPDMREFIQSRNP